MDGKAEQEDTKSEAIDTCLIAVRNPWGLKNPVIQNTFGLPSKHQFLNWLFLSSSSVYQNPSVEDSHEIWSEKKHNLIKLNIASLLRS